jgi:hypothetical protein
MPQTIQTRPSILILPALSAADAAAFAKRETEYVKLFGSEVSRGLPRPEGRATYPRPISLPCRLAFGGVILPANIRDIDARWRQFESHFVHRIGNDL